MHNLTFGQFQILHSTNTSIAKDSTFERFRWSQYNFTPTKKGKRNGERPAVLACIFFFFFDMLTLSLLCVMLNYRW